MISVLFVWLLSMQCHPTILEDWYIFSPNNYEPGSRNIARNQTSYELNPEKPLPGCVIAWKFDCTPLGLTIDGIPMWGE